MKSALPSIYKWATYPVVEASRAYARPPFNHYTARFRTTLRIPHLRLPACGKVHPKSYAKQFWRQRIGIGHTSNGRDIVVIITDLKCQVTYRYEIWSPLSVGRKPYPFHRANRRVRQIAKRFRWLKKQLNKQITTYRKQNQSASKPPQKPPGSRRFPTLVFEPPKGIGKTAWTKKTLSQK